jgi:outer membrane protein TolC
MRWKKWVGGLALTAAAVVGCKQEVFMTLPDRQETKALALEFAENNPRIIDHPLVGPVPTPVTTSNPDRKPRYIALAEALSISLQQGATGFSPPIFSNSAGPISNVVIVDTLAAFNGRGINASGDAVQVLRLDPAIVGAGIDSALSKFDAVWTNSMTWQTTDRPVGTSLDTFQAAGQVAAIDQQQATFRSGIIKPLSTGGVAGITFTNVYTYTNLPSRVNPSYQPTLQFAFEQPLLQGFGTEINELRPNHPGSLLEPGTFNTQPTQEGILLTRLRYDQQRAEFERNVQIQLFNVEAAYWNLYAAYWNLYAQETGLRIAYETWRIFNAKYQAGSVNLADFSQTRGQYELFRSQRLQALNDVLEKERELRYMLGLPIEDGERLVPADSPTLAPYVPDWTTALQESMALKPELVLAREEVHAAQMNLRLARDNVLPDIRLTATYDVNSIGSRLDGPDQENAFRNLASDRFNNWSIGLQGNIPFGYRDAYAKMRVAKLGLARALEVVKDQELKHQRYLAAGYRQLDYNYQQIRINRAQREAYQAQLRGLAEQVRAGKVTVNFLLEAQRFYAAALASEYNSIRDYNESLIGWEYAKGTIMGHDNVVISDGPLPCAVKERAVEHQRERSAAIELRERARPADLAPVHADCGNGVLPVIPPDGTPSLPALMQATPPLPPDMPLDRPLPAGPVNLDAAGPKAGAPTAPAARPLEQKDGAARELPPINLAPAKPKPDAVKPDAVKLDRPAEGKGGGVEELPSIGSVGTTPRRPAVDWSLSEQPLPSTPPPRSGEKANAVKKPTDFGTMRPVETKLPEGPLTPGAPAPVTQPTTLELPRSTPALNAPAPVAPPLADLPPLPGPAPGK